jgi:magnesium-transporting ATPase (P-type)
LALDHTFIGLIALNDPLRASAKASIKYAKIGHINIRLVTNNSLEYAKAQAYECGIVENKSDLDQSGVAMTGKEFSDLYGPVSAEGNELKNQIAFNNAIEDLKVLARATSDDKNLLAVGLKNQG